MNSPQSAIPPQPAPGEISVPSSGAGKQAPLILLAEDNAANIVTISTYLKAKGYRLITVKNGQEAVRAAQEDHPDLILMDIQMPIMNGFEAIAAIRQNVKIASIPIIALTALAMEGDREECLAAGADHYMSKPIRLKNMAKEIDAILAAQSSS